MKPIILKSQLHKAINAFHDKKILVIGDLILDQYIWGDAERLSPEAPVPVVWAKRKTHLLGGAANVASNISAAGGKVSICGIIGEDEQGALLTSMLNEKNIDAQFVMKEKERPTTVKTRVIVHSQQMLRLDWESQEIVPTHMVEQLIEQLKGHMAQYDAVIIEDYGKGVINASFLNKIRPLIRDKVVTVDPKEEHFKYYKHFTSLTPNTKEAEKAVFFKLKNNESILKAADIMLKKFQLKSLLITMGEKGMGVFTREYAYHIPTTALEVFDVSGAGDTVIAFYTLALTAGLKYYEAAFLSNIAAGIKVGKLGTVAVTKEELFKKLESVDLKNRLLPLK